MNDKVENTEALRHRGLSRTQEWPNSFEALRKGKKGDVFEMDVNLLVDGQLAITHQRDAGITQEELEAMSLTDFEKLNQQSVYEKSVESSSLPDVKMPLLAEILGLAYDREIGIQLELKASNNKKMVELAGKIVDEVSRMKDEGGFQQGDKYLPNFLKALSFVSFSAIGMGKIKKLLDRKGISIPTYLSWVTAETYAKQTPILRDIPGKVQKTSGTWLDKGIALAKEMGMTGIVFFRNSVLSLPGEINPDLDAEAIQKAHNSDMRVIITGPINDQVVIDQIITMGADGFVSEILK